ncbi:MAG TPA: NAD-dependent epimerase/dehydratase family protein [Pseudonocardia sp.]|jgi:nucleoside-diphosphate-sugar epimerase|nr:NAD-dependent epimerase/dehydratase family protein [Pseudonocardia sp.]
MTKVLVTGASGVVGSAALDRFLHSGWDVVAVSRRAPEVTSARPYTRVEADLRDAEKTREALSEITGVTHVVHSAVYEMPGLVGGWTQRDHMDTNLAMLRNTLSPLLEQGGVEQVSIMQGTKAYGVHLHPLAIPARESDPRDAHENFYWLQEDHLKEQAEIHGFRWNVLRPQPVIGAGPVGAVMSLTQVIGMYAAICHQLREPCGYPGGPSFLWEASDARLCAAALEFFASNSHTGNEIFNVTNGDVFEWRALWPALMDQMGVKAGPDTPRSVADYLPAHAAVWDEIVSEQGLRPNRLADMVGESHHFADFCFAHGATETPPPAFVSSIKIRNAGLHEFYDTEDTFRYWLDFQQERRILPRF